MVLAEDEYIRLGKTNQLSLVSKDIVPCPELELEDMRFLYKKMRKEGHHYYTIIKESPFMKRCPYCEKRDVEELDHYLSQKDFPIHCITPANLIPSCPECNHDKLASDIELVHPYFDDTTQVGWLFCELKIIYGLLIPEYYINFQQTKYDSKLKQKIVNTFNCLELHTYYAEWAAALITNKTKLWKSQYDSGGVSSLVDLLEREMNSIDSRLESINSYKKVFYKSFIKFISENEDLDFLKTV